MMTRAMMTKTMKMTTSDAAAVTACLLMQLGTAFSVAGRQLSFLGGMGNLEALLAHTAGLLSRLVQAAKQPHCRSLLVHMAIWSHRASSCVSPRHADVSRGRSP